MTNKGFDNLSREIKDSTFASDLNDTCDYAENTKGSEWTENELVALNLNI